MNSLYSKNRGVACSHQCYRLSKKLPSPVPIIGLSLIISTTASPDEVSWLSFCSRGSYGHCNRCQFRGSYFPERQKSISIKIYKQLKKAVLIPLQQLIFPCSRISQLFLFFLSRRINVRTRKGFQAACKPYCSSSCVKGIS